MIPAVAVLLASSVGALACERDGVRLVSDGDGAPDAFVALDAVPLSQPFSLQIAICGSASPADIGVDAIMPAHQHGMNYDPVITDKGGGVFEVAGLVFHMPGLWELRIDVSFDAEPVRYTHTVVLE